MKYHISIATSVAALLLSFACVKKRNNDIERVESTGPRAVLASQSPAPEASTLPLLILDGLSTDISSEETIVPCRTVESGGGEKNTIKGAPKWEAKCRIKIRGNSSLLLPKKSLSLKLLDSENKEKKLSLFGMPADDEWVLTANYLDFSLLRNTFSYQVGKSLKVPAPESRLFELYFGEEYFGIYSASESIHIKKNLVDITKLKKTDVAEPQVTGGYLFEVVPVGRLKEDEFPVHIQTTRGSSFVLKSPKSDSIQPEQRTWFTQHLNNFEDALYSIDPEKPDNGLQSWIDFDSAIDYILMNELAKNPDAAEFASIYFQKERGAKIVVGPLWDFDIAYQNSSLISEFDGKAEERHIMKTWYWKLLLNDPLFKQRLRNRWFDLRKSTFSKENLLNKLYELNAQISPSAARNFTKWPHIYNQPWAAHEGHAENHRLAIDILRQWISTRLEWLDKDIATL